MDVAEILTLIVVICVLFNTGALIWIMSQKASNTPTGYTYSSEPKPVNKRTEKSTSGKVIPAPFRSLKPTIVTDEKAYQQEIAETKNP
jgi:hypothetical protein